MAEAPGRPLTEAQVETPEGEERGSVGIPEDRRKLGLALAFRAPDCTAYMDPYISRRPWVGPLPSREYAELVRRINEFATLLIARWLVHGTRSTREEIAYFAARGEKAASERQASVNITRAYHAWRDAVCDLLAEEAERLETPHETLAEARRMVRISCDVALVAVAEAFDRRLAVLTEELERDRRLLAHQAFHDALTELPNRVLLGDRLGQAVLMATRAGTSFAILSLDLDGFKAVNDTHGHLRGDEVLRQVARRLVDAARESDTVARVGGDEFVVLLPGADARATRLVATRVLRSFRAPVRIGDLDLPLGTSIGAAVFPDDGTDPTALLAVADERMYSAKKTMQGGRRPTQPWQWSRSAWRRRSPQVEGA